MSLNWNNVSRCLYLNFRTRASVIWWQQYALLFFLEILRLVCAHFTWYLIMRGLIIEKYLHIFKGSRMFSEILSFSYQYTDYTWYMRRCNCISENDFQFSKMQFLTEKTTLSLEHWGIGLTCTKMIQYWDQNCHTITGKRQRKYLRLHFNSCVVSERAKRMIW